MTVLGTDTRGVVPTGPVIVSVPPPEVASNQAETRVLSCPVVMEGATNEVDAVV